MPQAPRYKTRSFAIDALRGLAALAVLFQHVTNTPFAPKWGAYREWIDPGLFGVMLFFLLSGYCIAGSLEHGNTVELKRFAIRRLCRLYPAYWASLALAAFVYRHPASLIAVNATMLQQFVGVAPAIAPYWTLKIELVFYVLAAGTAILGLFATASKHRALTLAIFTLTLCAPILKHELGWPMPVLMLDFLSLMFAGSMLRVAERNIALPFRIFAALTLVLCVFYAISSAIASHFGQLTLESWALFVRNHVLAILLFAGFSRLPLQKQAPFFGFLGKISYSLYLLNLPLIDLITRTNWFKSVFNAVGATACVLFLSVVAIMAAALSYHFIEAPMISLGRKCSQASPSATSP